jgi:hypothetical protein
VRRRRREGVPGSALEALEVDAVAEEAVELRRRDDAGDVAVPESQLEVRCSEARFGCDRGSRRTVLERAQPIQHVRVDHGRAAIHPAQAKSAGVEVLGGRAGRANEEWLDDP